MSPLSSSATSASSAKAPLPSIGRRPHRPRTRFRRSEPPRSPHPVRAREAAGRRHLRRQACRRCEGPTHPVFSPSGRRREREDGEPLAMLPVPLALTQWPRIRNSQFRTIFDGLPLRQGSLRAPALASRGASPGHRHRRGAHPRQRRSAVVGSARIGAKASSAGPMSMSRERNRERSRRTTRPSAPRGCRRTAADSRSLLTERSEPR